MRKRRWLGLVLAPLVAALVILPATAAYANGWERAVSRWSGMCIDLHGNGEIARQWNCNGSSAQLFVRVNVGGGYVQLINQRSGQCLGVSEGATWAGALINQGTACRVPSSNGRSSTRAATPPARVGSSTATAGCASTTPGASPRAGTCNSWTARTPGSSSGSSVDRGCPGARHALRDVSRPVTERAPGSCRRVGCPARASRPARCVRATPAAGRGRRSGRAGGRTSSGRTRRPLECRLLEPHAAPEFGRTERCAVQKACRREHHMVVEYGPLEKRHLAEVRPDEEKAGPWKVALLKPAPPPLRKP